LRNYPPVDGRVLPGSADLRWCRLIEDLCPGDAPSSRARYDATASPTPYQEGLPDIASLLDCSGRRADSARIGIGSQLASCLGWLPPAEIALLGPDPRGPATERPSPMSTAQFPIIIKPPTWKPSNIAKSALMSLPSQKSGFRESCVFMSPI
jgi:hypothetical protein